MYVTRNPYFIVEKETEADVLKFTGAMQGFRK